VVEICSAKKTSGELADLDKFILGGEMHTVE